MAVELVTTVHAALVLLVVEATIRSVSVERLSARLGCPLDMSPHPADASTTPQRDLDRRARRELRCAYRVAAVWPFSDGPCLRRALVAGHLLRRLDTRLRLGTYDEGGRPVAHAWLLVGRRPLEDVSGYRHFDAVPAGSTSQTR